MSFKGTVVVVCAFLVVGGLCIEQDSTAKAAQGKSDSQPQDQKHRELRTWTDITGKHKTEATFLDLKDGTVLLKKMDGAIIAVPLERLSDVDQDYVRHRASHTADNKLPAAPSSTPTPENAGVDPKAAVETHKAAEPGPRSGPRPRSLPLLRRKAVQEDLKLTSEQIGKMEDISIAWKAEVERTATSSKIGDLSSTKSMSSKELWERRQKREAELSKRLGPKAEETERAIDQVLTSEQVDRLNQICLRQKQRDLQAGLRTSGPLALLDPVVAKELAITDKQRSKLRQLGDKRFAELDEAEGPLRVVRSDEYDKETARIREKQERVNQSIMDEALRVLTPKQRDRLEEMKGKAIGADLLDKLLYQPARGSRIRGSGGSGVPRIPESQNPGPARLAAPDQISYQSYQ